MRNTLGTVELCDKFDVFGHSTNDECHSCHPLAVYRVFTEL